MSLLLYKRPDYIAKSDGPLDVSSYKERVGKSRKAIPSELCFDYVVSNRAMPPCSLYDFMGYLLYISHDAENLQFYLWLQDYQRRFDALPPSQQVLSPVSDQEMLPQPTGPMTADPGSRAIDQSFEHARVHQVDSGPADVPVSLAYEQLKASTSACTVPQRPMDQAYTESGLKWKPFTMQPFRNEVDRIVSHYISPGAPRELNLSFKNRNACLHALQHTTHPSAFDIPSKIVTETLRSHSHPNFIRWSMVNGNTPRMIFGRALGMLNIVFGFLIAFLLLFSLKPRWWRIFAALAWFIGFGFLLAGSNGICFVLYVTKDRHLRPWEQFSSSELTLNSPKSSQPKRHCGSDEESDQTTLAGSDSYSLSPSNRGENPKMSSHFAIEAFGTANSYGHEVWVEKYRAKMMIRKIFDTRVWVQNEHLRLMQDKVALQSALWSLIVTVLLTILFVALPNGHGY